MASETIRIPAEIWKRNSETISKVFILDKEINDIILDPFLETADVDKNIIIGHQETNQQDFSFSNTIDHIKRILCKEIEELRKGKV